MNKIKQLGFIVFRLFDVWFLSGVVTGIILRMMTTSNFSISNCGLMLLFVSAVLALANLAYDKRIKNGI